MNSNTLTDLKVTDLKATHSMFGKMLDDLIRDAGGPGFIWQLAVLPPAWASPGCWRALCGAARSGTTTKSSFALRFAAASLERAIFPLCGWLLVLAARFSLAQLMSVSVLRLALVPLFGITFLYIAFYILRRVLSGEGQLHGLLMLVEKVLTTLVWASMLLYVLGVLWDVVGWMETVRFSVGGKQQVNLADTLMAVVWILLTVLIAMWFGSWLEERLMRSRGLDSNLKMVLSRISRPCCCWFPCC